MAHPNAKLTPLGRLLLVQRVINLGWPVSQAAASLGISRETAYRWLRRWGAEGLNGLEDRSSRPRRSPRGDPAGGRRAHPAAAPSNSFIVSTGRGSRCRVVRTSLTMGRPV